MSGAPIYKIVSKVELRPMVDSMNHAVWLIAFANLLKVISLNPSEGSEVRGMEKNNFGIVSCNFVYSRRNQPLAVGYGFLLRHDHEGKDRCLVANGE